MWNGIELAVLDFHGRKPACCASRRSLISIVILRLACRAGPCLRLEPCSRSCIVVRGSSSSVRSTLSASTPVSPSSIPLSAWMSVRPAELPGLRRSSHSGLVDRVPWHPLEPLQSWVRRRDASDLPGSVSSLLPTPPSLVNPLPGLLAARTKYSR